MYDELIRQYQEENKDEIFNFAINGKYYCISTSNTLDTLIETLKNHNIQVELL